jgi:2-polyprenyl-3-methyl-5-hydroxy-6-metoxy-1,4-benzoquinol methylase
MALRDRFNRRRVRWHSANALRAAADRVAPAPRPEPPPPEPEPEPEPVAEPEPPSKRYERVDALVERLHLHHEVDDYDSRKLELIDYFGWETGHKADACRRWFFGDDPEHDRFLERLDITYWEYAVMHQYALFNRFDRHRKDLFWVWDEIMRRLDGLGGPERLSVLDFGSGLGQIGLAFTLEGYRTVLAEKVPEQVEFARFLGRQRGVELELYQAKGDRDYYDTAADGRPFGCVIEWSVFEHVYDLLECTQRITSGLVPGGIFVTTTLAKDWTPELREHYIRDAGDEEISEQLFSPEIEEFVSANFDVVSPPETIAKLLVKKGA